MILTSALANHLTLASATLDLVHALCVGATDDEVLRQGMFVYQKVQDAQKNASRSELGFIPSTSSIRGLLADSEEVIEASGFEVAQLLLGDAGILAEAHAISPVTDPLVAYTGVTLALAKYFKNDPPMWVVHQAHPLLADMLPRRAVDTLGALLNLELALPQILPLARAGKKWVFRSIVTGHSGLS